MRIWGWLVAVLVVVVGVSGCESEPKPKMPEHISSSSPSAGESTQVEVSELGAKAFIREYVRRISDAVATGHTKPFLDLSAGDCADCYAMAHNVREVYKDGGRIETLPYRMVGFRKDPEARHSYRVVLRSWRERWYSADGERTNTTTAGERVFVVKLSQGTAGWVVQEMRLV